MKRRGLVNAAVVVVTLVAAAGCARTVDGTAQRTITHRAGADSGFGYADDRCGLLDDSSVREVFGAQELVRPYIGAVCQYMLLAGSSIVDVTFSWFESGSFEREIAVAERGHASITELVLQRHRAFVARPKAGNSCSVTASTDPGVASWWVQFRSELSDDPCRAAEQLLSETLSAEM